MSDYDITPVSPGKIKISKRSFNAVKAKHPGKTWHQLSTADKIEILAAFHGITDNTIIEEIST